MLMSWASRKRFYSFLRSSLWVVPALSTLAAFFSAPLLRMLDRHLGFRLFQFSPDGARAAASVVAAAMLSFVVLFFSVLMLTVQIASGTLSPRIIARPFRSRTLQASLGLFVFTLIYSLAVVTRGTEGDVGQLAATTVFVLTIISICVFLYVVEHVSKQLRPVTVMTEVAWEGLQVISTVYPLLADQHAVREGAHHAVRMGMPSRVISHDGKPGVVLAFDIGTLVDIAIRGACTIEIVPQIGDFVATSDPVFRLYGGGSAVGSKELLQHIALGRERTLEQDPAFAFRIIVDIASKALSPAINDPTTAVLAIDQIHTLLREVGLRRLDIGLIHDSAGELRLVYRTPDWEDFVELAVTEVRQFGANSTQVVRRMRAMLENLIQLLPAHRSSVLQQELDLLKFTIDQGFVVPQDRKRADCPDFQGLGGAEKLLEPICPVTSDSFWDVRH